MRPSTNTPLFASYRIWWILLSEESYVINVIYEIKDLFIVYFHIGADYFQSLSCCILSFLKNILEYPGQNSSGFTIRVKGKVIEASKNWVGFASTGLSICKNAAIIPLGKEYILQKFGERILAQSCDKFLVEK